jgi:hypothetical protein
MDELKPDNVRNNAEKIFTAGMIVGDNFFGQISNNYKISKAVRSLNCDDHAVFYLFGAAYQVAQDYCASKEEHLKSIESLFFSIDFLAGNTQRTEAKALNKLGIANKILFNFGHFLYDDVFEGNPAETKDNWQMSDTWINILSGKTPKYQRIAEMVSDAKGNLSILKNEIILSYIGEDKKASITDNVPVPSVSFMAQGLKKVYKRANESVDGAKRYPYAAEFLEQNIYISNPKYKKSSNDSGLILPQTSSFPGSTGRIRFFT